MEPATAPATTSLPCGRMAERDPPLFTIIQVVVIFLTVVYGVIKLSLSGDITVSHILDFFGVVFLLLVYWLGRYDKYSRHSQDGQHSKERR
ncbi:hypothetical protein BDQ17DRAFT_1349816 [Cyathus striatus]|nr:hypothetical protein BDQ17DRAFT_1349816 [Cyathus striatus]